MRTTMADRRRAPGYSPKRIVAYLALVGALFLISATAASAANEQVSQVGNSIFGADVNSRLGWSVALSADGSRMVTGAPGSNDLVGHVRVYDLVDGAWTQVGDDIDGEAPDDRYGISVAISADGGRVVAGSSRNDDGALFAGHVRAFDLIGGSWVQVGQDIDGTHRLDELGTAVAISADGTRIATGTPELRGFLLLSGETTVPADGQLGNGELRVFDLVDDSWIQVGGAIHGAFLYNNFGTSIAMSADGTRIVAGEPGRTGLSHHHPGRVRVFELVDGAWTQVGDAVDGDTNRDRFGFSVAISGDGSRFVASSPLSDVNGTSSGRAQVFELIDGQWTRVGNALEGTANSERLGRSVSISPDGSRVAALATGPTIDNNSWNGLVRVYDLINDGTWVQFESDILHEAESDQLISTAFGANGTRLAVGAIRSDGNGRDSGQVRVFDLQGRAPGIMCGGVEATIVGTQGDDVLRGTNDADVITGLQGNDTIRGFGGDDIICGGLGNDTLFGGQGFDIIYGAQGNDVIYSADGSTSSLRDDVRGMRAFGGAGNDDLYGSNRWDRMQGGQGADRLFGYDGQDWLRGGAGDDRIDGGASIDDLHGGNGNDALSLTDGDSARGGAGVMDRCQIVGTPTLLLSCETLT